MADTTNLAFKVPTIGGSEDTWGTDLNANWTSLDSILFGGAAIKPNLASGAWKVGSTAVTATAAQLNHLTGATSNIQTQINGKQASDAGLTSIAGLTTAADRMIYTTASDTYAVTVLTSFARTLLDDTTAATARATLGFGDGFLPTAAGAGSDLDDISASGVYQANGASVANVPGAAEFHTVWHAHISANLASQIALDLSTNYLYTRKKAGGAWGDWTLTAPVGVGQTWQDVSGSRSGSSTSYQNSTDRPIMVSIRTNNSGAHEVQVSADDSTWVTLGSGDSDSGLPFSFIVPPGQFYRYTGGTYSTWCELR